MRCPTCQTENPTGAPFCAECGTRLNHAPIMRGPATGTLPQQSVLQDRYVIT
jgi:serine/threonine-protein kinase